MSHLVPGRASERGCEVHDFQGFHWFLALFFFIIFIVISVSLDLFPCVTNKSFFFFLVPVLALFYLSATP